MERPTSKGAVAATIRELKAREEAQRLEAQSSRQVPAANLDSKNLPEERRSETALETLLGLKSFVPLENLTSYLSFISYLSKREEEDVFVRLIQFLAVHTKLGQKIPVDLKLVGEEMIQNIRQALARDIGSWKEEHESLIRIKHEFQGSIASMLKEHREAHQKHLTFLLDAVLKTVTQLEKNQNILSEELQLTALDRTNITSEKPLVINASTAHFRSGRVLVLRIVIGVLCSILFGAVFGTFGFWAFSTALRP
jgi:hypothetical protein